MTIQGNDFVRYADIISRPTTTIDTKIAIYTAVEQETDYFTRSYSGQEREAIKIIKRLGTDAIQAENAIFAHNNPPITLFNRASEITSFIGRHPQAAPLTAIAIGGILVGGIMGVPVWVGPAAGVGIYAAGKHLLSRCFNRKRAEASDDQLDQHLPQRNTEISGRLPSVPDSEESDPFTRHKPADALFAGNSESEALRRAIEMSLNKQFNTDEEALACACGRACSSSRRRATRAAKPSASGARAHRRA